MNGSQWLELCELAEKHCPTVLLDLESITDETALGVLKWLRTQSEVATNG